MVSRALQRRFRAIVFDWDGTAVSSRQEELCDLILLVESLLDLGVWVVVVAGTKLDHIDRQIIRHLRPRVRRQLIICTNRGSEVWRFGRSGEAKRRHLRRSTPADEQALTATAEGLRDAIVDRTGLNIEIVYDRLNRRKVDLIPEPEWSEPPKSRIAELMQAVDRRLRGAGLAGGLEALGACAWHLAAEHGIQDPRITSDAKHIEIGLTDKGDSVRWVMQHVLEPEAISIEEVLLAGDEFGPMAGLPGSDTRMLPALPGAVAVSVGVEPNGVPKGVIHLSGGPAQFAALLKEQLAMRGVDRRIGVRSRQEPWIVAALTPTSDSGWSLRELNYEPAIEHEIESRFAVSNGFLGTRASVEENTTASRPRTYVAGLYDILDRYSVPTLVPAPDWLRLRTILDGQTVSMEDGEIVEHARTLDLRRGLMLREWVHRTPGGCRLSLRSLRLAFQADRSLALQLVRIETDRSAVARLDALLATPDVGLLAENEGAGVKLFRSSRAGRQIAVASSAELDVPRAHHFTDKGDASSWTWMALPGQPATLSRIVAIDTEQSGSPPAEKVAARISNARRVGVRRLLDSHVRRWQERWDASDIEIQGDERAQEALRFAIYHLVSAANPEDGRTSISARGLTGDGYMGHVFWDTDLFLLPFYVHTWPDAARSLLMYRWRTLEAARDRARALGYRGALFAWESADTGEDVTPRFAVLPDGQMIPIETGAKAHHISADIAYAVWNYWQCSGDSRFLKTAGAEILLETARFWASRARLGTDSRYHIPDVIGPDEYHEGVNDNAYTNVMARWNLDRGLQVARLMQGRWPHEWVGLRKRLDLGAEELDKWRDVSQRLATGFDPESGLFEQFDGFHKLQHIDLRQFEPRIAPIDTLLGRERTQESQVIKQADVVMFLHLLWDDIPPPAREANFRYYEPRCAHGSSLSPPIHAAIAARLGDLDRTEEYLQETIGIDLGETHGRVAGGVHMASQGGLWQAAVFGFAGVGFGTEGLRINPHLPRTWESMRFPLRWRKRLLRVEIQREPLTVGVLLERGPPLTVSIGTESRRLKRGELWPVGLAGMSRREEAAS